MRLMSSILVNEAFVLGVLGRMVGGKGGAALHLKLIHLLLALVLHFLKLALPEEQGFSHPGLMCWKIALHVYEGVPSK